MRHKNSEPPESPRSVGAFLRWSVVDTLAGRRRRAPRRAPMPVVEPDVALIATGEPSLTWVGHATWLVCLAGRRIVTDPVWSKSLAPGLSRNVAPGLPLDVAAPDVVLVSHNHRDHLDVPTIRRIGKQATYVVPTDLAAFLRRRGCENVVELAWWETWEDRGLRVTLVPAQHWSRRGLFDENASHWGGFVVEGDGRSVYFAGDTAYFGGFLEIGRRFPALDAALLPIGAYEPEWFMQPMHMGPEHAVAAFRDLGARLLCAMHWGTFKLTDEPLDEPPVRLRAARVEAGLPEDAVWIAAIGETRRL